MKEILKLVFYAVDGGKMLVYFKNKKENLFICVETNLRPIIGDQVYIKNKIYIVKKVIWHLEDYPVQSGIIAEIEDILE